MKNNFLFFSFLFFFFFILTGCPNSIKGIPKEIEDKLEILKNSCSHQLFLYNAGGNFTEIRIKPINTTFLLASVSNNFNQNFNPNLIIWKPVNSNYVPIGVPINGNFQIWVNPNYFGNQQVEVQWINKNGEVECTIIIDTPCKINPEVYPLPIAYDFFKIEKFIKENVKNENGILKYRSKKAFIKIYDYLSSMTAENEWELVNNKSIDTLSESAFLRGYSKMFEGYESLFDQYDERLKKVDNEEEINHEGFIDDELNAMITNEKMFKIHDKFYRYYNIDTLIEIKESNNPDALIKTLIRIKTVEQLANFEKSNPQKFRIYDLNSEESFKDRNDIFRNEKGDDPCDQIGVTTEFIPLYSIQDDNCPLDETSFAEIKEVNHNCSASIPGAKDYTFKIMVDGIDAANIPGINSCNCFANWKIIKKRGIFGQGGSILNSESKKIEDLKNYTFTETGNYDIEVVINCNGEDIIITADPIEDLEITIPNADFNTKQADCEMKVSFSDQSEGAVSYKWTFYDLNGTTLLSSPPSPAQNPYFGVNPPNILHAQAGVYNVKLEITDSEGCKVETLKPVEILSNSSCSIEISDVDWGCFNDPTNIPVTFEVDLIGACSNTTYSWNFGDGSTSNLRSPTHNYNSAGIYNVTVDLSTTTADGSHCTSSDIYTLILEDCRPNIDIKYCTDGWVQLDHDGAVNFPNFGQYVWDFPSDAKKKFLKKWHRDPWIKFDDPGIYSGNLEVDKDGCGCKIPFKIELTSVECCRKRDRDTEKYTDNGYRVKHKFIVSKILGWQRIKNVVVFKKKRRNLPGYKKTKADKLGFTNSGLIYSNDGTCNPWGSLFSHGCCHCENSESPPHSTQPYEKTNTKKVKQSCPIPGRRIKKNMVESNIYAKEGNDFLVDYNMNNSLGLNIKLHQGGRCQ